MARKKKWYNIQAAADDTAEISIFGDIGASWWNDSITASDFKKDFDEIKDSANIKISINSPGGNVFDGLTIYNIIATVREKVDIEVMGVAASISSIIALAGKSLAIREGAFFMIHNPSGMVWGTSAEMREMADTLDKIAGEFINIYKGHSDLSAEELKDYMDAETWFTAKEAEEAGFADDITESEEIAAHIGVDVNQYAYRNVPDAIRNDAGEIELPATVREFEGFLREAGYPKKEAVAIASHGFEAGRDAGPEPGEPDLSEGEQETKVTPPAGFWERMVNQKEYLQKNEGNK